VPTGYATLGRLIGATADAAAGTVEWNVAITTPPPGKPSLTRALRSSERHLKNIMHQNLGTPPGGTGP